MTENRGIFIGATGQNVGKTTICLGLIAGLRKRLGTVGFIKPVGQQHLTVAEGLKVDKDVVLFKEYFKLESSYADMSPVLLPKGHTRKFLDGEIADDYTVKIKEAYEHISRKNDFTLVEGTGHVGVGSIVGMNNAKVAAELGLDMIIIASGGLGSAHDELALNIAMCHKYGVKVKGLILNRVFDKKREMILNYFPKALKHWGIPLIGCVPFNEFLSTPSMQDFKTLFNTQLLSGHKYHYRHFKRSRLVAGSFESYLEELVPNELIITPASRDDIILGTLEKGIPECGMILTGRHPIDPIILKKIEASDVPVLYAPIESYVAMEKITSFVAKTRVEDTPKIEEAIQLVEKHVDFDAICPGVQAK